MQSPEEQNDPVWNLLKQARPTEASPFFSRNVVREVRKLEAARAEGSGLSTWLSRLLSRPLLAGGALAALLALAVAIPQFRQPSPAVPSGVTVPIAQVDPQSPADSDFDPTSEIGDLEYLGQLMAVTDPALLDDAALADLLF